MQFDTRSLIGLTLVQATELTSFYGKELRVVCADGLPIPIRADWRPHRIDVWMADELISDADFAGLETDG